MNLKENINIDLAFKCSHSLQSLNEFKSKDNNLIFKSFFWENIFCNWIKTIIDEKNNFSNEFISNKRHFSLSFHIVNNKEISTLNQKWLNKKGPTDVISFPILLKKEFVSDILFVELGDIFISLEMASIQSIEYRNSLKREMLFLASHGLLHLLGWEHNTEKQLKSMLSFQEYLISKLNL